jgi:hypothetical protein
MAHARQTLALADFKQHCCPAPSWLHYQLIRLIMVHAQQTLAFTDIQQHFCPAPSWLQYQLIRLLMAHAQRDIKFSLIFSSTAAQLHHGCSISTLDY